MGIDIEILKKHFDSVDMQDKNYNTFVYSGEYGTGIVVRVQKHEATKHDLFRLIKFNNEEDVIKFLELYKEMSKQNSGITLVFPEYESFSPEQYKFIKNGTEYTFEDVVSDRKKEDEQKRLNEQRKIKQKKQFIGYLLKKEKKYYGYQKKIENLADELARLEECIKKYEHMDFSVKQQDLRLLSEHKNIEIETDANSDVNLEEILRRVKEIEITELYIRRMKKYEQLEKKMQMYLKKMEYIKSVADLPKIKKLFYGRKKFRNNLSLIEETYQELSEEELQKKIDEEVEFQKYKYDTVLGLKGLKGIDVKRIFEQLDEIESVTEKKNFLDSYIAQVKEENEKQAVIGRQEEKIKEEQSEDFKNKRIYKDLIRQYNENLTQEEKDALLIYNSSVFTIINLISSIPDYENLSKDEISKIMHSEKYSKRYKAVKFVLDQIIEQASSCDNDIEERLYKFATGDYVQESLNILNIINGIKGKIILPEDITVYRCITNETMLEDENPMYGQLMSTSMGAEGAKKYYGEHGNILIKFELKKGMPVSAVFPKKVMNNGGYDIVEDLENPSPILEIMFNMNDFTIDKSKTRKSRINAYTFENNIGQIARSEPLEKRN